MGQDKLWSSHAGKEVLNQQARGRVVEQVKVRGGKQQCQKIKLGQIQEQSQINGSWGTLSTECMQDVGSNRPSGATI